MALAKSEIVVVLVTVPGIKDGNRISRAILTLRLAACVTVIPSVQSLYRWKGKIVQGKEAMLFVKTTRARYKRLERKVVELHPYEVPEIIAVPLACGLPLYVEWVVSEVAN